MRTMVAGGAPNKRKKEKREKTAPSRPRRRSTEEGDGDGTSDGDRGGRRKREGDGDGESDGDRKGNGDNRSDGVGGATVMKGPTVTGGAPVTGSALQDLAASTIGRLQWMMCWWPPVRAVRSRALATMPHPGGMRVRQGWKDAPTSAATVAVPHGTGHTGDGGGDRWEEGGPPWLGRRGRSCAVNAHTAVGRRQLAGRRCTETRCSSTQALRDDQIRD